MEVDLAIVGAGASGALLAIHLQHRAKNPISIALIDRFGRFGRGVAYSAPTLGHLLNVPAIKMSAFSLDERHFVRWMEQNHPPVQLNDFVSRRFYGEYLQACLNLNPSDRLAAVRCIVGDVQSLKRKGQNWVLELEGGQTITAARTVLATGNLSSTSMPWRSKDPSLEACYRHTPWDQGAFDCLSPEGAVLLLGTGLTWVDAVLMLSEKGHRGPIWSVSRRGLIPRVHTLPSDPTEPGHPAVYPRSLRALCREVIRSGRWAEKGTQNWRGSVDALRPYTAEIWRGFSAQERNRFLRHARPYWDVHRHRMAPQIADVISQRLASGQLKVLAGRLGNLAEKQGKVRVELRRRGQPNHPITITVDRILNCTGPAGKLSDVDSPLVKNLLESKEIRPDRLGIGFDTDAQGRCLDFQGAVRPNIFALGPLRKGTLWESVAVPDIRVQAEHLAAQLLSIE